MKRENNFYYIFIMFLFVTCYLTCYILSNRIVEFGGLIATASALIYPFTYFVAILFYERYEKNKVFELINFSITSLVFMGLMIALSNVFKVHGGTDGLEAILNIDFRILFSSVVAFIVGQYINIKIYDFLEEKKWYDFLISGTIAITVDSFLFISLSYLGSSTFKDVLSLSTGQYVISVIGIIIYSICFHSLIPYILKAKKEEESKEIKVTKEEKIIEEPKKEVEVVKTKKAPATKKASTTKKTTTKKDDTKKASTTKKTTAKKDDTKKASTTKKTTAKKDDTKKTSTTKKTTAKKESKKA